MSKVEIVDSEECELIVIKDGANNYNKTLGDMRDLLTKLNGLDVTIYMEVQDYKIDEKDLLAALNDLIREGKVIEHEDGRISLA